jgi:hypothetical protein
MCNQSASELSSIFVSRSIFPKSQDKTDGEIIILFFFKFKLIFFLEIIIAFKKCNLVHYSSFLKKRSVKKYEYRFYHNFNYSFNFFSGKQKS